MTSIAELAGNLATRLLNGEVMSPRILANEELLAAIRNEDHPGGIVFKAFATAARHELARRGL